VHYNCQFDEVVQLTKNSAKKMSLEVVFETVESRCVSVTIGRHLFSAGMGSTCTVAYRRLWRADVSQLRGADADTCASADV